MSIQQIPDKIIQVQNSLLKTLWWKFNIKKVFIVNIFSSFADLVIRSSYPYQSYPADNIDCQYHWIAMKACCQLLIKISLQLFSLLCSTSIHWDTSFYVTISEKVIFVSSGFCLSKYDKKKCLIKFVVLPFNIIYEIFYFWVEKLCLIFDIFVEFVCLIA